MPDLWNTPKDTIKNAIRKAVNDTADVHIVLSPLTSGLYCNAEVITIFGAVIRVTVFDDLRVVVRN